MYNNEWEDKRLGKLLFSLPDAVRLTGLGRRRINYWISVGFIRSVKKQKGAVVRHYFDFSGLLALRVAAKLLNAEVSLNTLKKIIEIIQREAKNGEFPDDAVIKIPTQSKKQPVEIISVKTVIDALEDEYILFSLFKTREELIKEILELQKQIEKKRKEIIKISEELKEKFEKEKQEKITV